MTDVQLCLENWMHPVKCINDLVKQWLLNREDEKPGKPINIFMSYVNNTLKH